jgi:ATP-binding cassette subfamily B protein
VRRLARYLEGSRGRLALLVLVTTGDAACQTGGWLLVRTAIDRGIVGRDEGLLGEVVGLYLGVAAIGWVLQFIEIRGLAGIGQRVVIGLRRDLFNHLTSLSLRYFSQQKAGWIIARLTSDVDAVSDTLSDGLPVLLSNAVLLPVAVITLLIADWRLGLVVFAVVPPSVALSRWFQRTSAVALLETRNRIAAVTAQVAESVAGMAVVQAFRRERAFQDQFDELNAANREQAIYAQKLFSIFFPAIEYLGVIATVAVLYVGARLYIGHSLTIGTLIIALYLLQLCFQPLQALSDVYAQLQSAAAAMVKIARAPRRCRTSSATWRSTTSRSPTVTSRSCTAWTSTSPPAAAWPSSANQGAASPRWRGSSVASTTPTRARSASTASTCATCS